MSNLRRLLRRPGSRAIMAACDGGVSYHTNGGRRSRPPNTPSCHAGPSNRPSWLRAPPSSCLSSDLIVGSGLICTGDKIRATHTHTHTHIHFDAVLTLLLSTVDAVRRLQLRHSLLHIIHFDLFYQTCRNTGNDPFPICEFLVIHARKQANKHVADFTQLCGDGRKKNKIIATCLSSINPDWPK